MQLSLVIDEIQSLEDVYGNGEKELLKEFLNFCVALTKETHLSHVIMLSSNTILNFRKSKKHRHTPLGYCQWITF